VGTGRACRGPRGRSLKSNASVVRVGCCLTPSPCDQAIRRAARCPSHENLTVATRFQGRLSTPLQPLALVYRDGSCCPYTRHSQFSGSANACTAVQRFVKRRGFGAAPLHAARKGARQRSLTALIEHQRLAGHWFRSGPPSQAATAQGATLFVLLQPFPSSINGKLVVLSVTLEGHCTTIPNGAEPGTPT
jgi:hypothetical protein